MQGTFRQRVLENLRKEQKSWKEYGQKSNALALFDTMGYILKIKNWDPKFRKLAKRTVPVSSILYVIAALLMFSGIVGHLLVTGFLNMFTMFNEEE